MVRFNSVLAALACAILGAPPLASCESDTPPAPDPTGDEFPLCEGNKSDDPSCQIALPGEDAVSSTDTNDSPDTTPPEPPPPDCSKVTDPYSAGTWLDCGPIAGQCQIEWHYDEQWGCLASCPPAFENRRPEDFSNPDIGQCPPANL